MTINYYNIIIIVIFVVFNYYEHQLKIQNKSISREVIIIFNLLIYFYIQFFYC